MTHDQEILLRKQHSALLTALSYNNDEIKILTATIAALTAQLQADHIAKYGHG